MSEDTKGLTPALTSEQWERLRAFTEQRYLNDTPDWLLTALLSATNEEIRRLGIAAPQSASADPDPYVLAAVALNALPAEHPGKLTWEDVAACLAAESRTWHDPINGEPPAALVGLAVKLAAFLPPSR